MLWEQYVQHFVYNLDYKWGLSKLCLSCKVERINVFASVTVENLLLTSNPFYIEPKKSHTSYFLFHSTI